MVAGFIIREMNVPFLTSVSRNYTNLNAQQVIIAKGSDDFVISNMTVARQGDAYVGQRLRLNDFIIPEPGRVPFSMLTFEVVYGGGNLDDLNDSLIIYWRGEMAYLVANRPFANSDFQGFGVEVWIIGTDGRILSTIFVENVTLT